MTWCVRARRHWRSGPRMDRCRVTLVFNVKRRRRRRGRRERLDGRGSRRARCKVMSDGNWRLGVFIDAAASDEQAESSALVFSGAIGGPMEALGPLVGEQLGVERAPIDVQGGRPASFDPDRGCRGFRNRGRGAVRGGRLGQPAKLTGIFHPAGNELTVAHATRSKIDAFGIPVQGNAAFSTSGFSW